MSRREGFILLELLLALAVSAVAMSLFWKASSNRIQMLTRLEENYAFKRLTSDVEVLKAFSQPIVLNTIHYLPLELNIMPTEILIVSQSFKTRIVLINE